MKAKKYIVSWHEENDGGIPVHVMGAEMFDTRGKARKWIDDSVEEDKARHDAERYKTEFVDETVDDGIVHTYGNGQHAMYTISEIEVDDHAMELVGRLKEIFQRPLASVEKYALVHSAVYDFEREFAPRKKYRVDVRLTPIVCVHGIEATSADEAERIVSDMIYDRTLDIRPEQVMPNLLESVESVGDAEEESDG